MSDFLLLKNIHQCPRCMANRRGHHTGRCQNCGAMLFNSLEYDFQRFDMEGPTRLYWAFCPQRGWVSRSYILNPTAKAQTAHFEDDDIPSDYGKQYTPEDVQSGRIKQMV
jgi:hypothetical protein